MTDNRLLIGYYRLSMEDDTDNESTVSQIRGC